VKWSRVKRTGKVWEGGDWSEKKRGEIEREERKDQPAGIESRIGIMGAQLWTERPFERDESKGDR
jgi:hypothetical protein